MQSFFSYPLSLLFFLSCTLQAFYLNEAQIYIYSKCNNTVGNYISDSLYDQNIKLFLSSLLANVYQTGFNTTTVGQNPDAVYGLVQCNRDMSSVLCQTCVSSASTRIKTDCPNQKEAFIGYDNCLIHYSNMRFFSTVNSTVRICLKTFANPSDKAIFNRVLVNLVEILASEAASNPSKFATGNENISAVRRLYARLQCTRDLTQLSCLTCLEDLANYLPDWCNGKIGCQLYSMSCNLRYEVYGFSVSTTPPPSLLEPNSNITRASDGANLEGKTNTKKVVFMVVIPVVGTLVVLPAIWSCLVLRKAKRKRDDADYDNETNGIESLSIGLRTLTVATQNFSITGKLGEGGFGPVYKGKLQDGHEIAVKRLSNNSVQGLEELKTEVVLVAKLLHRNLVRLLGFCLEDKEKLLVYEYLPNGSLDKFLFDKRREIYLEWERRYKIIVGIARGLLYLHEDSQFRIIHRDLKASNILLDQDMNPKISDFGLAKLFCGSQTHGNTKRISGTFGYMAPEYVKIGNFSTKSDVYSFGILVLEIITGRKNSSFRNETNLQSHAWHHWSNGTPLELMDPSLDGQWPRHEVLKCIHMALLCVQESAVDRPRMSEVVMMLNNYTVSSSVPSRPAFFVSNGDDCNPNIVRQDSLVSECEVTITELLPRD